MTAVVIARGRAVAGMVATSVRTMSDAAVVGVAILAALVGVGDGGGGAAAAAVPATQLQRA